MTTRASLPDPVHASPTTGRYERWVRRSLRGFPRRWRRVNGDELVATALAAVDDRRRRPPNAVLADIVTAGWRERRRDRPPFWRWLMYVHGARLPARWHGWLRDDIEGSLYLVRRFVRGFWPLPPLLLGLASLYPAFAKSLGGQIVWISGEVSVVIAIMYLRGQRIRRLAYHHHGLSEDGASFVPPLPGSAIAAVPRTPEPPSPSVPVSPVALVVSVCCAVVGGAMCWGAAYPRSDAWLFGRHVVSDGNAPVSTRDVALLAAVATVAGAGITVAAARWADARAFRVATLRPPLPRSARQLTIATVGALVLIAATGAWMGYESVLPDLASAITGALILLTVGPAAGIAYGMRARPGQPRATLDDLRPRRRAADQAGTSL